MISLISRLSRGAGITLEVRFEFLNPGQIHRHVAAGAKEELFPYSRLQPKELKTTQNKR